MMAKEVKAFLRRLFNAPVAAPANPKRQSPQGAARAAGWLPQESGLWVHPTLGSVTRQRDGTWATFDTGGFATMTEAMDYAAGCAGPEWLRNCTDEELLNAAFGGDEFSPPARIVQDSPQTGSEAA